MLVDRTGSRQMVRNVGPRNEQAGTSRQSGSRSTGGGGEEPICNNKDQETKRIKAVQDEGKVPVIMVRSCGSWRRGRVSLESSPTSLVGCDGEASARYRKSNRRG